MRALRSIFRFVPAPEIRFTVLFSVTWFFPLFRQFDPQLILVSAGYDAHKNDRLAGMNLDVEGFGQLVHLLNSLAQEVCEGRILFVLEGGYNLKALSEAIVCTIATSIDPKTFQIREEEQTEGYVSYREQAQRVFLPYWDLVRTE